MKTPTILHTSRVYGLHGTVKATKDLPGDKSLSHRALIFGALANGITRISGLNDGEDVVQTREALCGLGVSIVQRNDEWIVSGRGGDFFKQPSLPLYLGNSGTSARLLCGLVAPNPIQVTLYGDSSLSKRPMQRVITPLREAGVDVEMPLETSLPLTIKGSQTLKPITYSLPVASAQVKTALILAAMQIQGISRITETIRSRDHTERLLEYLEYPIIFKEEKDSRVIEIVGRHPFYAKPITIPSDSSAASILALAALITPNSVVQIQGVCWNPFRNAVFRFFQTMGGNIEVSNERMINGEPVVDLEVSSSVLKPVDVPADYTPYLIDEYPVLSMAAAFANGTSTFHGLGELRFKESDRLQSIATNLNACGVKVTIQGDNLTIEGTGSVFGGARIHAQKDHRIAMAFYVLGMIAKNPLMIQGANTITTSFPGFLKILHRLGVAKHED